MEDVHLDFSLAEEIIREEDLNIGWTDKKSVEEADDDRDRVRSDDGGVGHMFGSPSELSQRDVDRITLNYKILNQYLYQAPKKGKYMSDLGDKDITIVVAHLKARLRFPLHPLF